MVSRRKRPGQSTGLFFMFRRDEWWGLFSVLIGATSIGIGLYWAVWFALRPLYYRSITYVIHGTEWLVFPLFFGLGGLLLVFGRIELCDALPSHRTRPVLEAEAVLRPRRQSLNPGTYMLGRQLILGALLGLLVGVAIGWVLL